MEGDKRPMVQAFVKMDRAARADDLVEVVERGARAQGVKVTDGYVEVWCPNCRGNLHAVRFLLETGVLEVACAACDDGPRPMGFQVSSRPRTGRMFPVIREGVSVLADLADMRDAEVEELARAVGRGEAARLLVSVLQAWKARA